MPCGALGIRALVGFLGKRPRTGMGGAYLVDLPSLQFMEDKLVFVRLVPKETIAFSRFDCCSLIRVRGLNRLSKRISHENIINDY